MGLKGYGLQLTSWNQQALRSVQAVESLGMRKCFAVLKHVERVDMIRRSQGIRRILQTHTQVWGQIQAWCQTQLLHRRPHRQTQIMLFIMMTETGGVLWILRLLIR